MIQENILKVMNKLAEAVCKDLPDVAELKIPEKVVSPEVAKILDTERRIEQNPKMEALVERLRDEQMANAPDPEPDFRPRQRPRKVAKRMQKIAK